MSSVCPTLWPLRYFIGKVCCLGGLILCPQTSSCFRIGGRPWVRGSNQRKEGEVFVSLFSDSTSFERFEFRQGKSRRFVLQIEDVDSDRDNHAGSDKYLRKGILIEGKVSPAIPTISLALDRARGVHRRSQGTGCPRTPTRLLLLSYSRKSPSRAFSGSAIVC